MRCPHCNYNSFAHLRRCKKCGGELHEVRTRPGALADKSVAGETSSAEDYPPEVIPTPEARLDTASTSAAKRGPKVELEGESEAGSEANAPRPRSARAFAPEDFFLAWKLETLEAETDTPAAAKPPAIVLRRFIASVVDIAAILGVWFLFYTLEYKLLWEPSTQFFAPLLSDPRIRGGFYLLFVLIALGYFSIFHYVSGETPGKILTQIRVVSVDGAPLSLAQVLLRTCGGFISALCLGCGYMAIWFSASRRGWNDLLADTEVIGNAEGELED